MLRLLSVVLCLLVAISYADTQPEPPSLEKLKKLDLKYMGEVVRPNTNGSPTFNIAYHSQTWPSDESGKPKVGTYVTPMCMAIQIAKTKVEWLWLTAAHCLTSSDTLIQSGKTKSEGFIYTTETGWREAHFEVHPTRLEAIKKKFNHYDIALIRVKGDTEKDGIAIKTVPLSNKWIQEKDKVTVTAKWNPGLHKGTVNSLSVYLVDEKMPPTDPDIGRLSEECRGVDYEVIPEGFPGIKEGDSGSAILMDGKVVGVLSSREAGEGYAPRGDYTANEAMDWVRDEWSAFTGEKRIAVVESTKTRPRNVPVHVKIEKGLLPKLARGLKGQIVQNQILGNSPSKWTAFKVTAIEANSEADRAGLKVGDLILSVDSFVYETESKVLAVLLEPSAHKILIFSADKKDFTELNLK